MYDYAIIGAGINGSFMAYRLKKLGKSLLMFDPKGIGGSGSQAAGAFLAPKLGKGGLLKKVVNEAYKEAIAFYKHETPKLFTQKGLLHYPKTQEEIKTLFVDFKRYADIDFTSPQKHLLKRSCEADLAQEGLFFKDAGIIDPLALCHFLTQDIPLINRKVESWNFKENYWDIEGEKARHLIVASGGFEFIKEPYIALRPVWGERIAIKCESNIESNFHKKISISASSKERMCVIGATHEQHTLEKDLSNKQALTLLNQAKEMLCFENPKICDHRGGVRAGSFDYLPLLGGLVDSQATLEKFPELKKGARIDSSHYLFHKKLSFINGVGGRGFVLAPYLSRLLSDALVFNKTLPKELLPLRMFNRWVKKQKKDTHV